MRSHIVTLIERALAVESSLRDEPIDLSEGEATPLYGPQGRLDSLALVSVIVEVEQLLAQELDISLTLVSDKAMSARHSPFATIASFADHVVSRVAGLKGPVATEVSHA
jgi:acyl carrier protein